MKTVKEVSASSGVSVRTLHHYDAIGLLRPSQVTEAGYRLYDERALARLQHILLLRELQFPLRQIREILDAPGFDGKQALADQIRLLELQKARTEQLIALARNLQNTGVPSMDFSPFDKRELEQYQKEAKERWGNTPAWEEYAQKQGSQAGDPADAGAQLMAQFARLGALRHLSPGDPRVQSAVDGIRQFITKHYYTCTKEIFRSLGQMYAADPRFKENIDKAGGTGTADFAAQAISIYCK